MTLLLSFLILITIFIVGWIISGKIRNASIVDAIWALSLILPVALYVRVFEGETTRDIILVVIALTWSLRLGIHLFRRILKEHPTEDKRYASLRESWGENSQNKFLILFLINALLVFLLSLPFYFAAQATGPIQLWEWFGIGVFCVGLIGESIADYQLKQFKKSPQKPNTYKICKIGLWNYSRHPNYFFEAIIWFGIYLFCAASPNGIYTIHAPLIITFLLVKVTGIPPLEQNLLKSRGGAYRKYQQSTNAFIPWFKKNKTMKKRINTWLEQDKIPDRIIRFGIRQRLLKTLKKVRSENCEDRQYALIKYIEDLKKSPLAIATDEANEQHYELPTKFFQGCLGPHLKYSSGYWEDGEVSANIESSEARMLKLTCERAELTDGDRILELGCGWGSLTLWMAKHFPKSEITAISNSNTQREFINSQLKDRGLTNVTVKTINMIDYRGEGENVFDRVVSVEMFEHMKNYQLLLSRVSEWLKPEGKLFIHIFTHKDTSYHFEVESEDDWMSRYFFTGGQMPSDDLMLYFQDHLSIEDHWQVNGTHYERTSNAWLHLMDTNKEELYPLIEETYGKDQAVKWWVYWRCFYMACAELWGFRNGEEWFVSHYRFTNRKKAE